MKKVIILILIITTISNTPFFGQIKFEPELFTNYGYENNIFRAPDILEQSDGTIFTENDLILSDSYFDLGYELYAKYKLKKKHKFRLSHDLWNRIYSNNSTLNQFKINAKLNYDYKINKKMHLGFIYRFDKVNKIGTSVLGDELTQQFSYNKNYGEIHYKYRYMKFSGIQIGASYYKKVFDRSLNVVPLDYTNLTFSIGIGQRFYIDKIIFKAMLDLDYATKTFTDKIALNNTGQKLETNPFRIWNYYSGSFALKGQLPKGFVFKPYVKYKIRDDIFEDYYSYNSLSLGICLTYESERFEIKLTPEYQSLNYLVKTAPDPDNINDPFLIYNYINSSFYATYRIYKGFYLSADFSNKIRDTNTLDFSRTTRRSYKYYEVMGGIIIKPMEFF